MKQNENSTNENDHKLLTRYSATACIVVIFVIWNENGMEQWLMETTHRERMRAIWKQWKRHSWLPMCTFDDYNCSWIMGHFDEKNSNNYWSWSVDYIPASVFKWFFSARQFGKVCRISVSVIQSTFLEIHQMFVDLNATIWHSTNHGKYQTI